VRSFSLRGHRNNCENAGRTSRLSWLCISGAPHSRLLGRANSGCAKSNSCRPGWTSRFPDPEGRELARQRALGPYRDDGQLGRATKSNRKESSPDAATNVHPRTALGIPTFQKTSRPAGQPEDRYQRQADLSAVRVPGEHEGHATGDTIEKRRRVECSNHISTLGDSAERCVQIRRSSGGVVQANEPDVRPDGARLVQQEMDAKLCVECFFIAKCVMVLPVAPHEPNAQRCVQMRK